MGKKRNTLPGRKQRVPGTAKHRLEVGKSEVASSSAASSRTKSGKVVGPRSNHGHGFFDGVPANADQFGPNDGGKQLDIVVGVDLGTSSTKVVVHAPGIPGDPAFAVPFGDFAHESLGYLLPTRLFVEEDGSCSLEPSAGASVLTDIKLGLMRAPWDEIAQASGPPCNASATVVATAYLALVLQYVRCWFIAHKREDFGEFFIRWSCNLGLPAAIDDDDDLRETFRVAGKAAWIVSRSRERIIIEYAQRMIDNVMSGRSAPEDISCDFELVPEVIAEVVGYAKSRFRRAGLHVLVDVGASTLDVCCFNLHNIAGDDNYSILSADVEFLGAKEGLHKARIKGAKSAVDARAKDVADVEDPASRIPDDVGGYVPLDQDIYAAEENFKATCRELLYRMLHYVRKCRYPDGPGRLWPEELPVFFCGGATTMKVYVDVIGCIGAWREREYDSSRRAILIPLLRPESLEADIDDQSFHRLAVAWGLSREQFNIGDCSRPSQIENVKQRRKPDTGTSFVSKDMV